MKGSEGTKVARFTEQAIPRSRRLCICAANSASQSLEGGTAWEINRINRNSSNRQAAARANNSKLTVLRASGNSRAVMGHAASKGPTQARAVSTHDKGAAAREKAASSAA